MKQVLCIEKNRLLKLDMLKDQVDLTRLIFTGDIFSMMEIIRNTNPNLLLISLNRYRSDIIRRLMDAIQREQPKIFVLAIGTDIEHSLYEEYYRRPQFVRVQLPIKEAVFLDTCLRLADASVPMSEFVQSKPMEEAGRESAHILIVDDNPTMLRSIKQLLDDTYSVAVALSGEQCLQQIAKKKPDLILLDYEMPVTNGKEVFEVLQATQKTRDIPIVFLTGESRKSVVMEILSLQPAGYILKPPTSSRLLETIKKALHT